jgi:hypothetical protein
MEDAAKSARLEPLPLDHDPVLKAHLESAIRSLG